MLTAIVSWQHDARLFRHVILSDVTKISNRTFSTNRTRTSWFSYLFTVFLGSSLVPV